MIQYPPEAATLPIETTTGISLAVRSISWRMISDAMALPPPESMRKITAFGWSFCTWRNARAIVSEPMTSPPNSGIGE